MKTTKVVRLSQRTAMNKDHSRSVPGSVRPIRVKPDRVAFKHVYVKIQAHRESCVQARVPQIQTHRVVLCNPVYVESKPIEEVVCNPVYVKK